jgi:hypothetical protein
MNQPIIGPVLAWIRTARRFRHLDPAERRLVLEAALFTVAVRVALSALSLRTLRRLLQALLVRRGYSAHLRLGFARSEEGVLSGHAWVESEGRVFDDTGEASCYAPALWHRAPGGRRPSLADYVTVTGATDGATAAGGRSC